MRRRRAKKCAKILDLGSGPRKPPLINENLVEKGGGFSARNSTDSDTKQTAKEDGDSDTKQTAKEDGDSDTKQARKEDWVSVKKHAVRKIAELKRKLKQALAAQKRQGSDVTNVKLKEKMKENNS